MTYVLQLYRTHRSNQNIQLSCGVKVLGLKHIENLLITIEEYDYRDIF